MLAHLANGVRMQPEHPGRFTNTHSFDVAGSANPAIQLHRVDPATFSQGIVLCTRVNVSGGKFPLEASGVSIAVNGSSLSVSKNGNSYTATYKGEDDPTGDITVTATDSGYYTTSKNF